MNHRSTDLKEGNYTSIRARANPWVSKDWVIAILISLVGTLSLFGLNSLNAQILDQKQNVITHTTQLATLTQSNSEVIKRLDVMDRKLDRLIGWGSKSNDAN